MRLAILGFCLAACSAESPVVQRLYQATLPDKGPPAPLIRPFSGAPRGSPVQLASIDNRTYAWVADADGAALRIVDLDALEVATTLALGGEPSEMVMFDDGSLAIALRDTSEIVRVTAGTKPAIRARIDVATEPLGLALAKDTLLVASGWGRTLTAIATDRFVREWRVGLEREPKGVSLARENPFKGSRWRPTARACSLRGCSPRRNESRTSVGR